MNKNDFLNLALMAGSTVFNEKVEKQKVFDLLSRIFDESFSSKISDKEKKKHDV